MKYLLSLTLYWIGDTISHVMTKFDWVWLYPIYNRLMIWSSDLDTEGRIWERERD